ncbi:MAG TPA: TIGR00282 family metallophosphoesterase [Clostridiaceae bacterium]|nr:TIGR00282 family metallophosphoesterase [Clostridiaceae bacterium]
MNVLFIGDVVGNPGRRAIKELLPELKREYSIDFCIANGENAAGGSGITYVVAQELYKSGIDAITMGNHVWSKKEIFSFIESDTKIIRPANYLEGLPGKGSAVISNNNGKIGIINLMGRIYMEPVECPFRTADKEVEILKNSVRIIIVDMHAEATSEKTALAWYLDGKVSGVIGTHTHVQTADERILPFGTGFITDVGMTGPYEGIIGVKRNTVIEKFITFMPARFELEKGKIQLNAVVLEIDDSTGKTIEMHRIMKIID